MLSFAACAADAPDSLRIEEPAFGPGTVRIHISLAPGYADDSLAVKLDGRAISAAFRVGPDGATAVVAVGEGVHELVARARFEIDGRTHAGSAVREFQPPPPLPPLLSSDPSDGASEVPRTAWLRLRFANPLREADRAGIELSCDGVRRPVAIHQTAPRTVILDPDSDLATATSCAVTWRGRAGPRQVRFATAPDRLTAHVLYDRGRNSSLAPFPDDYWLRRDPEDPSRQRLAIRSPGFERPDRLLVDALLAGTRELDGFSPIAHITIELSQAPDPYSMPWTPEQSLDPMASVGLFDVSPDSPGYGERVPFRMDVRTDRAWNRVSHTLLLFPSISLEPGRRYGVVVTRRALANAGRPFDATPFFRAARDHAESPADSAALRRVRRLAEDVLRTIETVARPPIRRDDVALALRFSVRHTDDIPRDLLAIKNDILDGPAPAFTIDSVTPENAAAVANGSDVAAVVRGTWQAPEWREKGLLFRRDDATDLPLRTGEKPVGFVLAMPAAAREGPVPVVMYQHGNPGSAEEDVLPHARQMLARAGFAVIGFTDVLNREVSPPGRNDGDRAYLQIYHMMWHLLFLQRIPDYFAQTNAEQLAFLRVIDAVAKVPRFVVEATDGHDSETLFGLAGDRPLSYVGVSEGANLAPAFLAFAPEVRAAVLVSGGRRFSEVLIHQRPGTILAPLSGLGFSQFRPRDVWVMLALFQTIFDRQDAHNFAAYLYRRPFLVAGSTRRASILLSAGLNDSSVPNHVTEALASALGPIPQLAPVARRVPILGLADSPVVANIDAVTTAAFSQFVPQGVAMVPATAGCLSPPLSPQSANEGHYCVQNAPEALLQRLIFLETALTDEAPLIVNPTER